MSEPKPDDKQQPTSRWNLARLMRGGRRYALPWLSLRRWRVRLLLVGAALLAGLIAIAFAMPARSARPFPRLRAEVTIVAPAAWAAVK